MRVDVLGTRRLCHSFVTAAPGRSPTRFTTIGVAHTGRSGIWRDIEPVTDLIPFDGIPFLKRLISGVT